MDEATFNSLERIISYLYMDEYESFKAALPIERRSHIFNDIQKVSQYLDELKNLN